MLSKFHVYHLLSQEQKLRARADQLKSRRKKYSQCWHGPSLQRPSKVVLFYVI